VLAFGGDAGAQVVAQRSTTAPEDGESVGVGLLENRIDARVELVGSRARSFSSSSYYFFSYYYGVFRPPRFAYAITT
jgi:hypothetical protein